MLICAFITISSNCLAATTQDISYMLDQTLYTYDETAQICANNNMVLAQPKTEELWQKQVAFLNDVAPSTEGMWIGLRYHPDGKHRWLTGEELDWSNCDKASGEPDDLGTEICVRSEHDSLEWESELCTYKCTCLCQSVQPAITYSDATGLYRISNIDQLPESGLISSANTGSTISCAISCVISKCSLFAMKNGTICSLYDDTALQANWISSPDSYVYSIHT